MALIGGLDKFFGGKRGAAKDALAAYKRTYGDKDGQKVFDAVVVKAKRRRQTKGRR